MKYSAAAALLVAGVAARPSFTNTDINPTEGRPFTLTLAGCEQGCTISLQNGPDSGSLQDIRTLATGATTSFDVTLSNLASGTYSFKVQNNVDGSEPNYSSPFQYTGTGPASSASSTAVSAASSASATAASAASTGSGTAVSTTSAGSSSAPPSSRTSASAATGRLPTPSSARNSTNSTSTRQSSASGTSTRSSGTASPSGTTPPSAGSIASLSPLGVIGAVVAALLF